MVINPYSLFKFIILKLFLYVHFLWFSYIRSTTGQLFASQSRTATRPPPHRGQRQKPTTCTGDRNTCSGEKCGQCAGDRHPQAKFPAKDVVKMHKANVLCGANIIICLIMSLKCVHTVWYVQVKCNYNACH